MSRQRRTSSVVEPILLSIPKAGAVLGIGATKMAELVATGEIATVTIGRRRLVHRDELVRYGDELVRRSAAGRRRSPERGTPAGVAPAGDSQAFGGEPNSAIVRGAA